MEGAFAKQVRYGRRCQNCKAYFVTEAEEARLCPWCEKIQAGHSPAEMYDFDSQTNRGSGFMLAG
ncbi:MAG TPA: hypothetical protein VLX33_03400 [Nitrososphaerales archaeon]|nr:hypothetical protein [Nitrososphaerales archaeon]